MGYRIIYHFDDGSTNDDMVDEVFATREEAEEAAIEGASSYSAGRDVLELAGEDYCEEKITYWDIIEC